MYRLYASTSTACIAGKGYVEMYAIIRSKMYFHSVGIRRASKVAAWCGKVGHNSQDVFGVQSVVPGANNMYCTVHFA
jgi:hypothetical protein